MNFKHERDQTIVSYVKEKKQQGFTTSEAFKLAGRKFYLSPITIRDILYKRIKKKSKE